ncbi:MAG: FRG domain-containing protein [Bacteroidales bacterium]|nr:FRG domain-containing protein [Bacteroidales bacterium]
MDFKETDHVMTTKTTVKSLRDYISAVNYISHVFSDNLWYRGHAKNTFQNLPSLLREDTWMDNDYSYQAEYNIFKTFKRKSKIKKETDYEYLHLMQHYGLPTRLLDWTESSLIALFFAIEDPTKCAQPEVWIIDPWDFNNVLHGQKVVFDFYGTSVHSIIDSYINPKEGNYENIPDHPIAVLPSFYDDRVIAQKSGFILYGKEKTPLEELVKSENYFNLAKIKINTDSVDNILIDLNMAGIDHHTVYPDLYGLVKQIKTKSNLK